MGFLSAYGDTQTISVGHGYWIEIREHISVASKERAEKILSNTRVVDGGKDGRRIDLQMNTPGYRQQMFFESVVSWNLDDDNGEVWPISLENIRRLPGDVFDTVWKVIDDLSAPRGAEESRQFPSEDVRSDSDEN